MSGSSTMNPLSTKIKQILQLNLLSGGKVLPPDEDILVQKGNRLHLMILALVMSYCVIFSIVQYLMGYNIQQYITTIPVFITPIAYLLFRWGYPLLSKTINMMQVTTVIGLISMVTGIETGILAFFIPCFLGSLITFQGREQIYAYLLTFLAVFYLAFFLSTDIRIEGENQLSPEKLRLEWQMNFLGASIATIFQVIFLLLVSNRLQQNLLSSSDALRSVNERYELVVNEITNDVIWESNLITRKIQFGSGMLRYFGYRPEDIEDSIEWALNRFHPEDRAALEQKIEYCFAHKIPNWEMECRYLHANGTYRTVEDRGYILFDEAGTPVRMIGAISDITDQKALEQKLIRQKITEQKLITEITIQSQEKEKSELAAELHDNINQILAASKMYLDLFAAKLETPDATILKSYQNLELALQEIRKLSHSLVTPTLGDRDLFQSIKDLVLDQTQAVKMEVHFEESMEQGVAISDTRKLVFYRIVQEQVNNVLKYASATRLSIKLYNETDKVYLEIEDNGKGFDPDKKTKGIGLQNIQKRVELYSGKMQLETAPGKGCKLTVFIYLN
ncbi:MAG: PAS domain-containing protein [Bacteroidetes bacterium]|nr:PAS domain-containing protein [Bacteroidota bacterium]